MRAAILLLAGCWTSSPSPQPTTIAVENHPALAPSPVWHSDWRGTYTCAQGATALHVTLDRTCSASTECQVDGVFEFGPLPENPNVPHGSYRVTGTMTTNADGGLALTILPGAWLEQPTGYVTVGFMATSDRERSVLRGAIQNPSCGALELTRVSKQRE